ncbi:N-acetyllactosaminide beta-1,3-N-acetylglucosaminyltransferase 4-like [Scleropages formosus]|uniref:N-acetyllactosaminide beta-1,3-N-acetylglucosaminyltransferase 4-like n=1 Tax=Scleropages formosus TaxID=113540 RepID=UPI0010FA71BB|nr:N-acetyllactosaminide beta-1,3-N-acetylglucosaminyltransferase 4-like [Scleropages formosus]
MRVRADEMDQLRKALPRPRPKLLALAVAVTTLLVVFYNQLLTLEWTSELHRAFLTSRHIHNYSVVLRPRSCETRGPITLLLAIKSHSLHLDRREAIRNTWAKEQLLEGRAVRRVFLLGLPEGGPGPLDALVRDESRRHGDILQWAFQESFFNVTLKELLFWRWFQAECSGSALYVLKGDDDVFVDVRRVLGFLGRRRDPGEPLYVGRVFIHTYPVRTWWNKYYIPPSLFSGAYPPYMGGGGYLMSRETVHLLLGASAAVPLFPIDDAYVGMCAKLANVSARHHPGFMPFEFASSRHPCAYWGALVLHRLKPDEQYLLWAFYRTRGRTCPEALPGPSSADA